MINVKLFATLRDIAGEKAIDVPFEYGGTARDLVAAIEQVNPPLGREILDANGELTGTVHILVHGRNIVWLDDLDTVIEEGQDIDLVPPTAGG